MNSLSDSQSNSADSNSEDDVGGVRRLDSVSESISNSDSSSKDDVAAGGVRHLDSDEDSVSDSNSDSDGEDGDARRLFLLSSISIPYPYVPVISKTQAGRKPIFLLLHRWSLTGKRATLLDWATKCMHYMHAPML